MSKDELGFWLRMSIRLRERLENLKVRVLVGVRDDVLDGTHDSAEFLGIVSVTEFRQ